jgi:hypothetical protein
MKLTNKNGTNRKGALRGIMERGIKRKHEGNLNL